MSYNKNAVIKLKFVFFKNKKKCLQKKNNKINKYKKNRENNFYKTTKKKEIIRMINKNFKTSTIKLGQDSFLQLLKSFLDLNMV